MTDLTPRPLPSEANEVDLVRLGVAVLRQRHLVLGASLALALITATVVLVLPRTWSASVAFLPQMSQLGSSRLLGLAAQFGVNVGAQEAGESPEFYAEFLGSGTVIGSLVDSTYDVATNAGPRRGNLVTQFAIDDENPALARDEAVRKLGDLVTVTVGAKTGVVRFQVRTESPDLAVQIARRALDEVVAFNVGSRQSRAGQERRFIEGRLAEGQAELREAEDRLERFLAQNRDFRGSPQLSFVHERLQREVTMRQQLYTSLAGAFDQARIDEARNTTVITPVEMPVRPPRPDRRGLVLKTLLALIVGGLVGVGFAVAVDGVGASSGPSEEVQTLRTLATGVRRDLLKPWRLLLPARRKIDPVGAARTPRGVSQ